MRIKERNIILFTRIFLLVIYLVGIIGISIPGLRPVYTNITPVSLLISAMLVLAFHENWSWRAGAVFAVIALAGFLIEVAGVQTGNIFGHYNYGATLGWGVSGVPLIIGLNWFLLIYSTWLVASMISKRGFFRVLLTGVMMVLFDVIMEPVAVELDMWQWKGDGIPLENYGAWFAISVVFATLMQLSRVRVKNPVAAYLLIYMVFFFGVLNFTL